jgi:undecaprenyl-diphosphatase
LLLAFFGLGGGLLLETLIKLIVQRARPENSLITETGFSFPSGHATMSLILFTLLLLTFKNDIKNNALKWVFIVCNITLILLIGLSRIYLNVHWFSDVIGGFALGLFWLTLLILVFKYVNVSLKKRRSHEKNRDIIQ